MSRYTRRELLGAGLVSSLVYITLGKGDSVSASEQPARRLRVSVVQFRSVRDLRTNVERHCDFIRRCATDGCDVVVFPECSVTGYFEDAIEKCTAKDLADAEKTLCEAARTYGTYVIAGIPTRLPDRTFNSAIVITPEGKIVERYHKIHLAGEKWATPGDHLSVFPIRGVLCSIIVCHDERYPELVRLPVLAGAQVAFYISHESGLQAPEKIEPYRAQIVARAVENTVYVVHANTPWDESKKEGSHGQSRIVSPSGHVMTEAGIYEEQILSAELELSKADRWLARRSLDAEFLKRWWEEGIAIVNRIV